MITQEEIANVVMTSLQGREVGDETYWNDVMPGAIKSVKSEILTSFDWDFLLNDYTVTFTATAEQTVKGADDDLREIVSIRYSTGETVLQKMRTLDAYDLLDSDSNNTSRAVSIWYLSETNSVGFPIIKLIGTPTSSESAKILYRRRDVELSKWPDELSHVMAAGVMANLSPQHRATFERILKRAIRRHKIGGKDYNRAQMDPQIVGTNRCISDLYGTG